MTDSSPLYIDAVRMAATPGQRSSGIISVHNRGSVPASGLVRTVGLGEGWTTPSFMIGPIEPGERVETSLVIDVPAGFPPCEHLGGIEIEAMDTATGSSLGPAAFADLVLVIGDGAQIQATLDPPDVVGGGRARFFISLRNRARQPMRVRIEGESPSEHLSVHFDEVEPVLPPGQTVRIQGRIKSTRPLLGPRQRLPFFVRVQGRTTPITVDGSFSQGPVLSGGLLKILAIITVVALWGSLLVLGLGKLGEHKDSNATKNADAAAAAAAASSSDSGAGGNGTGSDNSNGNGNGGGGGGAAGATETKVGGKVKSKDPAGVTVSLQPTSLVDETAQGANFEQSGQPANALGMHYGHQSVDVQQLAAQPKSTTTDQNGEWAFGGVRAPGFYLLTFSKGGYATRKFVINAPDDGSPVNLDAELLPGDGSLAGTVFGPDGGPLGGVDLAITGGTNTLTTATPTTGAVGTWGVQGLSTPGTYLITASRRGFGTETQLVDLPAGGSNGGVDIHMIAGVGSISGLVTDGSLNAPGNGAKGVNVTVTSGDLTRTVSTATVGAAGEFAIPQLPLPGKYTVTVTGDGYLPSTQIVDLDPVNVQNASLQITLTPSTGSVTGFVVGPNIVPGDPLPNPLPPDTGLDNVGITIANGTVQAKTTSATAADGKFVQNHVPPGHYVVTFEKFGYITQSAEVDVKAGETTQVPETGDPVTTGTMHLPPAPPDTINLHGAVTVTVRDQRNGDLLDPTENVVVTYTNDSHPTPQPADIQQPSGLRVVNGVALFTGIDPGLATFTVKAKHFSSQKVQVKVIPNAQVDTSVAMLRNAVVQGTVRDFNGVAVTADDLHVSAIPVNAGAGAVNVDADITKDANNHPTGEYVFNGTLDQGNWDIAATSADYLPNDPTLSPVTVTPAKTFTVDINLHQLGRIQIASVQVPNASGTLVQTGQDLTFSISGGPTSKPDQTRDATHHFPITFTGLQPGAYTITVTGTGLTQRPPTQFFAQVDQTSTATLLMANTSPPRIPLRGRIVYDLNGAPVPVGGAVVSVTGTNYVTNGNPPPPFNVIHTTVPPPFIFAGTITAADGTFSIDTTGFDFSGGDVNVTANPFFLPTFVPQTFSNVGIFGPASPTAPTDFVVQPVPGSVSGMITYDPSTATDSKTAVVGTITSPSGTGISISVNSDGSIALHDPRVTGGAVNAIRPGTYTVSFTRSGFQPGTPTLFPTGSFTVDPGGSVDLSTVLEKHGSTLITVECTDATASPATEFTPPKARVTITNGSFSSTQVASQPASGGPLTATFDDLVSSATPYNIAAHAAGCTDGTNTVTVASGGQGTQTVELNKLGSISGTVVSKINATSTTTVGVQGAAVSTTDPVSGKVFTATSDQDGNFVLAGSIGATAAADRDGLHTGSYTVSANSSSQQPATVTTPASIDNTQPNLDDITVSVVMTAKPATFDGFVKEGTLTGAGLVGATVTGTSAAAGRTVTFTTTASTGAYSFTGLEPVLWTFTYTAPSHSSVLLNITLTAGSAVHHNEALVNRSNTISGVISSQFGTDTPAPEGNVAVHIVATNNGNTTDQTLNSGATNGSYSLGSLNDGTYAVTFSKSGFTDVTDNVTIANGQNFILNDTIHAIQSKATLTVVSAVGSAPIGASTVTLRPHTGNRGITQQAVTGVDGKAVFNQVPPSTYDVTITSVSGHRTVLDDATLAVPTGGNDVTKTFTIQEAHLHGTIKHQDTVAAATPLSPYTVQIYNGTDTTGSADFTDAVDASGVYDIYVPGRSDGYTFKFFLDNNHNQQNVATAATTGADVTTDFTFVKFGSISATVGSTTAAPGGSHYDFTIALDGGSATTVTSRSFSNLTPGNHTVHYTRTLVTGPSGSPPTTSTGTPDTHDSVVNLDPGEAGTDSFNFP